MIFGLYYLRFHENPIFGLKLGLIILAIGGAGLGIFFFKFKKKFQQ